MVLLAADIGNTTVHIGLSDAKTSRWIETLRFSSRDDRTPDDWFSVLHPHFDNTSAEPRWTRIVCCSVVPALTESFREYSVRYLDLEPLLVSPNLNLGISVATLHPQETGTDRIVNAVAAFAGYGGPVVVVDMGTATKVDAISREGEFLGGAIAPGLGLSIDSLARRAAQLRAVPLTVPERVIGRNTTEAVQAGVVLGHAAQVDGLVGRIAAELGEVKAVVMTGGYAELIVNQCERITHHRPLLTLDGLALIAALNP